MSALYTVFVVLQAACMAWVFWMLPTWSRPELFFGFTVPRGFRLGPEGRAILGRYRRRVELGLFLGLGAAALAALALPVRPGLRTVATLLAPALVGLGFYGYAYVSGRRGTEPHAVEAPRIREASLGPAPMTGFGRAHWIGFLIPLLAICAAAGYLTVSYEDLPDRVPVHFGSDGEPDRFAEKSLPVVLLPLALAGAIELLVIGLAWTVLRSLPNRNPSPEAAELDAGRRRAFLELLMAVCYITSVTFVPIALTTLMPPAVSKIVMGVVLVIGLLSGNALLVVFLVRHGRFLSTGARGAEAGVDSPVGDRTEDRHWKMGLIYYNPDDPAVWVEKRIGFGYTTNMARAEGWMLFAGVLLFVGALIVGSVLVGG